MDADKIELVERLSNACAIALGHNALTYSQFACGDASDDEYGKNAESVEQAIDDAITLITAQAAQIEELVGEMTILAQAVAVKGHIELAGLITAALSRVKP